jgi:signal transduction histidine kinase
MKLLKKTNRYFIGVSLLIFCLGGILFYFLFLNIIDDDINNKLHDRKDYYLKQLDKSDSLIRYQHYSANMLSIKQIEKVTSEQELLSDTSIFDEIENKSIVYRQLTFQKKIKDNAYVIQVRRAIILHEPVVEGVIILEALLFIAFVLGLTMINNEISKKIWKPFYFALDKITHYKVDLAQSMQLPRTSIDEFNELSAAIEKMSLKIHHEFNIQKEFSENASHEIQTPLAIVRSKLEVLLQSKLTEEQVDLINSVTVAVNRLSKLNEALIILSKIENRQFHNVASINVVQVIHRIITGLEELLKLKSISITIDVKDSPSLTMNPYLCEILIENLILNSVKHNVMGGKIVITVSNQLFRIANTGESTEVNADKLFQRFVKSKTNSQSLGLGLSIVKAVCETYLFQIKYAIEENMHTVSVLFESQAGQADGN